MIEGIQQAAVTEWFASNAIDVSEPLRFELITGGHSNLTYKVTDENHKQWVLRRPPLGHVLKGAHDMGREHRLLSSLSTTQVPVPPVVGMCTDAAVNDADFYVTEFVNGHVLRDKETAALVPLDNRSLLSDRIVEGLASIHSVDLDATQLADLGKKEDYVARQLRTWLRQFSAMTSRELPIIKRVHDALQDAIPTQTEATLIHGDYRLDNCLVTSDGHLSAVLDWEISTLGDPLADLGILLAYWSEASDNFLPLGFSATIEDGFKSRDGLINKYVEITGRDVSDIDYYFAFANWRLACILEGVHARYVGGANVEIPAEVEIFPRSVVSLALRAAEILGVD